jgi:hypothetical protein
MKSSSILHPASSWKTSFVREGNHGAARKNLPCPSPIVVSFLPRSLYAVRRTNLRRERWPASQSMRRAAGTAPTVSYPLPLACRRRSPVPWLEPAGTAFQSPRIRRRHLPIPSLHLSKGRRRPCGLLLNWRCSSSRSFYSTQTSGVPAVASRSKPCYQRGAAALSDVHASSLHRIYLQLLNHLPLLVWSLILAFLCVSSLCWGSVFCRRATNAKGKIQVPYISALQCDPVPLYWM